MMYLHIIHRNVCNIYFYNRKKVLPDSESSYQCVGQPKHTLDRNTIHKNIYINLFSTHNDKFLFVISPTVKKLTNKLLTIFLSKIESINQQLLPLGNISDNVDAYGN